MEQQKINVTIMSKIMYFIIWDIFVQKEELTFLYLNLSMFIYNRGTSSPEICCHAAAVLVGI